MKPKPGPKIKLNNPLIIESDRSVCLESDHPRYEEVREQLARFADLEKSPGNLHTYRISPISIWNAASLGMPAAKILDFLDANSRYPLPNAVREKINMWHRRYGALALERIASGPHAGKLAIVARDRELYLEARRRKGLEDFARVELENGFTIDEDARGAVKQILTDLEYPVEDVAGYVAGAPLEIILRKKCRSGRPFELRNYQKEAVDAFHANGTTRGGSGVVVLPCGSGKTVVGIAAMERCNTNTLVLTTSSAAVHQWCSELLDKTTLDARDVGEYTGAKKDLKPVTVTTYQMLTYRRSKTGVFQHFHIFDDRDWGLVIYDEVHLLPAPVFSITASLQARRRLGLTATLIREDGHESRVFSLIGPKRYESPWRRLEREGFIAAATCREVRVPLDAETGRAYEAAEKREQFRIACENGAKTAVIRELLSRHAGDHVLVIGQYLEQIGALARDIGAPLITGATQNDAREHLYNEFRAGRIPVLVISKVGNFAIDLPDANVAIQISGTFGSRQEEAQRLGRVLRPKSDGRPAVFYTVISADTREREFAAKRERFLTEQGYTYEVINSDKLFAESGGLMGGSIAKGVVA
ncbi:MAG: DEAD/DEAH box helicase [Planctomycetes bacterium]|nr:DEAD/DEAH box helicase [Planctomycetota bacterium]